MTRPASSTPTDVFPQPTLRDADYWFGYFTSGPKAGSWRTFPTASTAAPTRIVIDGVPHIFVYERDANAMTFTMYTVRLRVDPITPVADGKHFWLTEVDRQPYDGIL